MIRKIAICTSLALGVTLAVSTPVSAEEPATAAKPAYSTSETDIGTLLDNAETRAVLVKHLPGFVDNSQIEMARAMTLKQIQSFAADMITDEKLAAIDADLAKIAAK